MEIEGERTFQTSLDHLWDTLFETDVLQACIPGAQNVEQLNEREYRAEIQRRLASIAVNMVITVKIVDFDLPYRVRCELNGTDDRLNSEVTGDLEVTTVESDDRLVLTYSADMTITGRIASLGSSLIRRQVKQDLGTFFNEVATHL